MNRIEKYVLGVFLLSTTMLSGVALTYLHFQNKGMIGVVSVEQMQPNQYAELKRSGK